jgi:hypothetical protein
MTANGPLPQNEIKVMLAVLGFEGEPETVSRILQMSPTRTWVKGSPVAVGATNVHHQNGWALHSEVFSEMSDVDVAVRQVLDKFSSPHVFEKLPDECEVQLTVTIFALRERPGLWLSPQTTRKMAAVGASLDVDIYDLTSVESE